MANARISLALVGLTLMLTACGGGDSGGDTGGPGNGGAANAGPTIYDVYYYLPGNENGYEAIAGMEVGLAVEAEDPDGDALDITWTFLDAPTAGEVGMVLYGAEPTFIPQAAGTYHIKVTVSDGQLDESLDGGVSVQENSPPVLPEMRGLSAFIDEPQTLTIEPASDPEGQELTYSWQILDGPGGHAATLQSSGNPSATATFDTAGTYTIEVSASDGLNEVTETFVVESVSKLADVSGFVIDAEHSEALDAVLVVTSTPQRLYKFSLSDNTLQYIDLYKSGLAVSVSPDGLQAAIGFDAAIQIIDLQAMAVDKTLAVSTKAQDVVFGAGYVYAIPAEDQWEEIHSVEISTGTETLSGGLSIRAGTQAKLHPDGDRMYGADRGLSPSDIERYDVTSGVANYDYDSPYHGDYGMCGDLWISEDGQRIFTACGNTFSATDVMETDMRYTGSLDVDRLYQLDHSGETGHAIFTTISDDDYWYDSPVNMVAIADENLNTVTTFTIPSLGDDYEENALFTFFSADGTRAVLLMEAVGPSVKSFFVDIDTSAITAP